MPLTSPIQGPTSSQTPYVVPTVDYVTITSLITTGDSVAGSAPWKFAGIPDGIGAYANPDGTVTLLVNHELGATSGVVRDSGSKGAYVDLITIDPATGAVLSGDDLIQSGADIYTWNAAAGAYAQGPTAWNRFCSGDLAQPSAYFDAATGLGTHERIFLTGEEGGSSRAFAFVVTDTDASDGRGRVAYELPRLGNLSFENLVASADSGAKTVVVATDDAGGGQLYVYIGDKTATGDAIERAGLTNGQLFGVKVEGLTLEPAGAVAAGDRAFTLASLGDVSSQDSAQLEAASAAAGVTGFQRPEDAAWDPSNPNRLYFVTTNGFNAPSRLWALDFDNVENPAAGGALHLLLDGTEGQRMFDNITVTEAGKVIIEEDPGGNEHLAKIWMYDPAADSLTQIAQHDPARFQPGVANPLVTLDEESSGVIDVTSIWGDSEHLNLLFDTQSHKSLGGELVEDGQLELMTIDVQVAADATLAGTNGDDALTGTAGADVIDGDFGKDVIVGGGGDDHILGNYGNDDLDGGAGDDRVEGGVGDDLLRGGNGDDVLYGDHGADTLEGGNGDDALFGDVGADTLLGGRGEDRLDGGFGADILGGGQGDDVLTGGAGADLFRFARSYGNDVITDFTVGVDHLSITDGSAIKTVAQADVDGDGVLDTVITYQGGAITLLGVHDVPTLALFA